MKKKIVILLTCIIPFILKGQFDDLKTELLSEITTCETIATNSHKSLAELRLSDLAKSKKILSNWEMECGRIEPILRIRLLLDIYEGKSVDDIFKNDDWLRTFQTYRWKMDLLDHGNYGTYENNKGYYGYVPLNAAYDSMTKTIAELLLKNDSLDTTSKLVALYYSNQFETYDDLLRKNKSVMSTSFKEKNRERFRENQKCRLFLQPQIGMATYLGRMSSKTDYSGYAGIKTGIKVDKWRLNLDAKFHLHHALDTISVLVDEEQLSFKPKYTFQAGLELSRQVWESENQKFELIANIGGSNLQMDTYIKEYKPNSEKDENVYLSGFQFFTGIMANWEMRNFRHLGIQINYNYLHYNSDKYLNEKLDGHGPSLALIYNF